MATAMALMAEDIQKELAGRNMNIPVEVVAKVVSAEVSSLYKMPFNDIHMHQKSMYMTV